MITVVLDTNFLLYIARFKIDIKAELTNLLDEPFKLAILDKTMQELNGKKDSKLAIALAKNFEIIKTDHGNVDDLLTKMKNVIIATQDKDLKSRLKQKGLKILIIRQQNYLELI